MAEKSLSGVIRARDLLDPYLLVGLAGRIATTHERDSLVNRQLDRLVGGVALRDLIAINSPAIRMQYADVSHWHGTGRYQYSSDGRIDVLDSIAATGKLLPNYDAFDLTRPMTSVSLARARIYGRAYADMHGRGADEPERYGSSLFWASAFLGSIAVEAAMEAKVWWPSGYHRMMKHLEEADALEWYKKVTRATTPTILDMYKHGSDIEENYPVLFGIRDVEPTQVGKAVALHEVRTEQPIDLSTDITHVEVPRKHLDDTRRLLGGIAIMALEDAEHHTAQYTFSEHMHGVV